MTRQCYLLNCTVVGVSDHSKLWHLFLVLVKSHAAEFWMGWSLSVVFLSSPWSPIRISFSVAIKGKLQGAPEWGRFFGSSSQISGWRRFCMQCAFTTVRHCIAVTVYMLSTSFTRWNILITKSHYLYIAQISRSNNSSSKTRDVQTVAYYRAVVD